MMIVRIVVCLGLIILYGSVFTAQERLAQTRDASLEFALPVAFQTIAAGYLKQVAAEMLFIKTSVFLGGLKLKTPPASYESALTNNFQVMSSLYPRFIDPYYYCEAFLPSISPEAAAKANSVLETGITAYPDDLIFRFYHGTNFFLWMNEPLKAAKAFEEAAKLPNAPKMFEHLAALMSAQGGQITAGLMSLKAMLASEMDENVRARYQEEIAIFEQALEVNAALTAYREKYSRPPETLQQLVPEFIPAIPEIKDAFVLVYEPPTLRLKRPDRQDK